MQLPEAPKQERKEALRLPEQPSFKPSLDELEKLVGKPLTELSEQMTEEELKEADFRCFDHPDDPHDDPYSCETYMEHNRHREINNRATAMQYATLDPDLRSPLPRQEFSAANQRATYHEYLPKALRQLIGILRSYESLRRGAPASISEKFIQTDTQIEIFLQELSPLIRERVSFDNIQSIDGYFLPQSSGPSETITINASRLKNMGMLSEKSRALLRTKYPSASDRNLALQRMGQELNQKIMNLLSGRINIPSSGTGQEPVAVNVIGLPKNYEPGKVVLNLWEEKYRKLIASQDEEVKKNPRLDRQKLSQDRLQAVNDLTKYAQLVSRYQLEQERLMALQHQFDRDTNLQYASPRKKLDQTDPGVKVKMTENLRDIGLAHLKWMEDCTKQMERSTLTVPLISKERMVNWLESFWNKNGRMGVLEYSRKLADGWTFVIPSVFGLKEKAHDYLLAPVEEALGWPKGKEKWEELTPEEKKLVLERSRAMNDVINSFNRSTMIRLRESAEAMRLLQQGGSPADSPSIHQAVVPQELAERVTKGERITKQNIQECIEVYGRPAVTLVLMQQLEKDWGSPSGQGKGGSGFMGEYEKFLRDVNTVIGVHIDVEAAMKEMQERYQWLMKCLFYSAAGLFVAGVAAPIAGYGLYRAGKGMLRGAGKSVSAAEKVAERASKSGRVGRVLGPLGIVLVAADLRRVMMRDARLEPLKELEGIQAGIEFMTSKDGKGNDRMNVRKEEIDYLERRSQCFVMEDGAIRLAQELEKRKTGLSANQTAKLKDLQSICEDVRRIARQNKFKYERLFPITDYFVTDPRGNIGNVGFDINGVEVARLRGYREQQKTRFEKERLDYLVGLATPEEAEKLHRDSIGYEELQKKYEVLLSDAAEFIENIEEKPKR